MGLLFSASLLPIENNFKLFTVQSGSMEPEVGTGSIIIVKEVPSYEKGDVITRKNIGDSRITITHRIVEKNLLETEGENATEGFEFRTKGDANEDADAETFTREDIIGKVLFHIPFLGFPINFIKTTHGFILLVVIPATILIYEEFLKIKKEVSSKISQHRKRKKKSAKEELSDDSHYSISSVGTGVSKRKTSNQSKK